MYVSKRYILESKCPSIERADRFRLLVISPYDSSSSSLGSSPAKENLDRSDSKPQFCSDPLARAAGSPPGTADTVVECGRPPASFTRDDWTYLTIPTTNTMMSTATVAPRKAARATVAGAYSLDDVDDVCSSGDDGWRPVSGDAKATNTDNKPSLQNGPATPLNNPKKCGPILVFLVLRIVNKSPVFGCITLTGL